MVDNVQELKLHMHFTKIVSFLEVDNVLELKFSYFLGVDNIIELGGRQFSIVGKKHGHR